MEEQVRWPAGEAKENSARPVFVHLGFHAETARHESRSPSVCATVARYVGDRAGRSLHPGGAQSVTYG
jgi:hypothetical protein